jgi:hypothetical protein
MSKLQGVRRVAISGLALAALIAACRQGTASTNTTSPPATARTYAGDPVQLCPTTNDKPVSRMFRVVISKKIDNILSASASGNVNYNTLTSPTPVIPNETDDDINATGTPDVWSNTAEGGGDASTARPYHVDLLSPPTINVNPYWVEIRFVLQETNDDGSKSNVRFYKDAKQGMHGLSVEGIGANASIVCVVDDGEDNGHGGSVLRALWRVPQDPSANPSPKSETPFNIVLVGAKGATSTPIAIDPKLMNNG